MYRDCGLWEDAFRVAQAKVSANEAAELALEWALSLGFGSRRQIVVTLWNGRRMHRFGMRPRNGITQLTKISLQFPSEIQFLYLNK